MNNIQLTLKLKLDPTAEQATLIAETMREYIRLVNEMVGMMVLFNAFGKLSSANVSAALPSAVNTWHNEYNEETLCGNL